MSFKKFKGVKSIYFIGIGGISMSSLAKLFATEGYAVSGSDQVRSTETDSLAFYGVRVFIGTDAGRAQLSNADLVVYTDAISETDAELQMARLLKKCVLSRGELLKRVCQSFPQTIAIAGSHGKTTCTAMCAHILRSVGAEFTAHIGGHDSTLGNFYTNGQEFFLTEACEYKRNLSSVLASRSVILNIDCDHMDCYTDMEDLTACFKDFALRSDVSFVCADDLRATSFQECITFGIENPLSDYRAIQLTSAQERYHFTVEEYGKPVCWIKLQTIGKCNVYNALAAFAVMRSYGFEVKDIKRGLEDFQAIKRRFECIGKYKGASFICDYAHHPRELASTLSTARALCKGRLAVVFQPHTYSRTKQLMREFVSVLSPLENLMVFKTYPAREVYDEEGSAKRLADALKCLYCDSIHILKMWLGKTLRESDVVLFLGAGDIYYIAEHILKELQS